MKEKLGRRDLKIKKQSISSNQLQKVIEIEINVIDVINS